MPIVSGDPRVWIRRQLFGETPQTTVIPQSLWLFSQPQRVGYGTDYCPKPSTDLHLYRTGFQTVGQGPKLFVPPPVRFEIEPNPPFPGSTDLHRFRQSFQTVGQPWFALYQPKVTLPEIETYSPQVDNRLFFGRSSVTATPGQPWYLWPQPVRTEEERNPRLQRDGDLHLYRQSFQTVGQPWALFSSVQIHPEIEQVQPPSQNTQLFFGRVPAVAVPGQPWFMWKGYQPQFETEIFRQPENPSLLLIYGRPQVTPAPPTGLHLVNMSVTFGMGLNRMGTNT